MAVGSTDVTGLSYKQVIKTIKAQGRPLTCLFSYGTADELTSQDVQTAASVKALPDQDYHELAVGAHVVVEGYGSATVTKIRGDGSIAVQYDADGATWSRVQPGNFALIDSGLRRVQRVGGSARGVRV